MASTIPLARRLAIPAAVALAIGVPAVQAIFDLGLSQAEFAAGGNWTLRAEGYAFSIWSLIYAGLIVHAVYQARPGASDTPVLRALGWPSAVAMLGCAVWIVAAASGWTWASVAIILAALAAMLWGLIRASAAPVQGREALLALWPLAMLAGWLTIAAAINVITVLTAEGMIGHAGRAPAALLGVMAIAASGAGVAWATRQLAYAVPISWGLAAVYVAEQADQPGVGRAALAGAAVVLAVGVLAARRPRAA